MDVPHYITALPGFFVGHMVGDYVLQNDYMALKKKQHTWNCLVHVFVYTVSVLLFCGCLAPLRNIGANAMLFAVIAIPHFCIDRSKIIDRWMKLIGQEKFRTGICAPWSSIVVDNVWHLVCLYLTAYWWFSWFN